jgi:hypothetical protein
MQKMGHKTIACTPKQDVKDGADKICKKIECRGEDDKVQCTHNHSGLTRFKEPCVNKNKSESDNTSKSSKKTRYQVMA